LTTEGDIGDCGYLKWSNNNNSIWISIWIQYTSTKVKIAIAAGSI
jgi:hypothetical protein